MTKTPNSEEIQRRLSEKIPGAAHYNFRFPWREPPIVYDHAVDHRAWDVDGNEYLDFYAGFGAVIVGHSDPSYVAAIVDSARRSLLLPHTELDEEVADLLIRYVPSAEMVRFGVTGTEAVQSALRLCRAFTGRNRFIRFGGHYHGHADNILGGKVGPIEWPIPLEFDQDPRGSAGLASGIREEQSFLLPWNDAEAVDDVLMRFGDQIAAIVTEPICINGGGILPKHGFLESLRRSCDRHGVLLVFDEIVTGFRVGLGGAQALYGVKPDLTTLGKAMGGGLVPVAAIVGRRDVMSLLADQRVVQAGTFNGYPLGLAAIKATIEILSRSDGAALRSMHALGQKLMTRLLQAGHEAGIPLVVQGHPSCFYYHCTDRPFEAPSQWTSEIIQRDIRVREALLRAGVITAPLGRFYPMVVLNEVDVEDFGTRVVAALEDVAAQPLASR